MWMGKLFKEIIGSCSSLLQILFEGAVQEGGDVCIHMADSCWGLTENSKIL